MKLPEEVENKILFELGIHEISNNPKFFSEKIEILRKQFVNLSQDFTRFRPTESQYQDAYFAFNFPQNFMKVWIVINKIYMKKNEWCHQSIKWTPPIYMNVLNQPLYRKIEYLKFSYLVISGQSYDTIKDNKYLVISRLFKEKGFCCAINMELLNLLD